MEFDLPLSVVRDELGSLLKLYHGTGAALDQFRQPGYSRKQQLGFGIHFAEEQDFARLYAVGPNPRLIEAHLDLRNPFHSTGMVTVEGPDWAFAKALYRGTRDRLYVSDGLAAVNLDSTDPKRAERLLRDHGYDGVKYTAKYGVRSFNGYQQGAVYSYKGPAWVALDPSAIHRIDIPHPTPGLEILGMQGPSQ